MHSFNEPTCIIYCQMYYNKKKTHTFGYIIYLIDRCIKIKCFKIDKDKYSAVKTVFFVTKDDILILVPKVLIDSISVLLVTICSPKFY